MGRLRILGIDPGTHCGWAIVECDDTGPEPRLVVCGTLLLNESRFSGAGMRFLRLKRALMEILTEEEIDAVGFEEVRRHRGTAAAHVYGGIVATIQTVCEELSIPYDGIPVGTVKRSATGKGNASKEMMLDAARTRLGAETDDFDSADACWVAFALADQLRIVN